MNTVADFDNGTDDDSYDTAIDEQVNATSSFACCPNCKGSYTSPTSCPRNINHVVGHHKNVDPAERCRSLEANSTYANERPAHRTSSTRRPEPDHKLIWNPGDRDLKLCVSFLPCPDNGCPAP